MRAPLTSSNLLRVWEEGAGRDPVDRPLLMLQAAEPVAADLDSLPLLECDKRLLQLRQATFGDRMTSWVNCPACGLKQEFELSAAELLSAYERPEAPSSSIELQGYQLRLRPLQRRHLAEAARCSDIEAAGQLLVSRAIARATSPQGEVSPQELPPALRQAVEQEISQREADVSLDLACRQCGHQWAPLFDIGGYLWSELEVEARRLLVDVAALAERFGWAEADILAMSPARRRAYLELEGIV